MIKIIALTVLGTWLGFANPWFQIPVAALCLPLGLSWIAFRALTPKHTFKLGWITSTLAFLGCLYWLVIPIQHYGGLPWYIALPCPVFVSAVLGFYPAIFTLVLNYAAKRLPPVIICLGAGVLWASLEIAGSVLLTGFPWTSLASALANWPVTVQTASIFGAYGLAGVFASIGVSLILFNASVGAKFYTIVVISGLIILSYIHWNNPDAAEKSFTVTMTQGNIEQGQKWDPEYQAQTLDRYINLTQAALRENKADLIIWPETAMPFYPQDMSLITAKLFGFVVDSETSLLTGAPAYDYEEITQKTTLYNRAFLITPDGAIDSKYDKEHLVPFGEYVPLKNLLPLGKLVYGVGDYQPGRDQQSLASNGLSLGLLICYESIFPKLAQLRVESGANLLVNISNDAWFGDSSAPWQHLSHARLRCIEQGRWMARSTNNGINAIIDSKGRVVQSGKQFRAESLTGSVIPLNKTTFYHNNYTVIMITIFTLTALFLGLIFMYKGPKKTGTIRSKA